MNFLVIDSCLENILSQVVTGNVKCFKVTIKFRKTSFKYEIYIISIDSPLLNRFVHGFL